MEQINSSTQNKNVVVDDAGVSKSTDEESFAMGVDPNAEVVELSNQELIRQAEQFTEALELEKAVSLYDEGLRRYPNDIVIIDAYTDLLVQLENTEKAKELIERSIQLNPNKQGRKYMTYAQMVVGHESLQMYRKGIEVLLKDEQLLKKGLRLEDAKLASKQVASAYASISEIYMTDLCDEPNAEQQCEEALKEALKQDQENIDALQSLANLRMVRNKDQEAKELLFKVYNQIQAIKSSENTDITSQMPSIDFRMHTSKLLLDLQEFKKSVKILDTIIQEEDEFVETWYLLAFNLCKLKKYSNARECLNNLEMLIKKQKITDQEFIEGSIELKQTVDKEIAKQEKDQTMQDSVEEEDDEGFETFSEEDVSDDNGEQDPENQDQQMAD